MQVANSNIFITTTITTLTSTLLARDSIRDNMMKNFSIGINGPADFVTAGANPPPPPPIPPQKQQQQQQQNEENTFTSFSKSVKG